jgi:hypothetical protein
MHHHTLQEMKFSELFTLGCYRLEGLIRSRRLLSYMDILPLSRRSVAAVVVARGSLLQAFLQAHSVVLRICRVGQAYTVLLCQCFLGSFCLGQGSVFAVVLDVWNPENRPCKASCR